MTPRELALVEHLEMHMADGYVTIVERMVGSS